MNRDDIIRMAREAGSEDGSVVRDDGKITVLYVAKTRRFFERFAALVAAAEREACARVCDDEALRCEAAVQRAEPDEVSAIRSTAWKISVCAAAIRARGEK